MKREDKNIVLLPHNEDGYENLTSYLEDNQIAALNRATGTGKSFIILKYLFNNRNKRILYLAPTYHILDQLKEEHMKELGIDIKDFKKFDTMIYSNLLNLDMKALADKYEIIIFDEYHRCGAPKWGKKVKELFEYIKKYKSDTKIIGTTATEIRYLDHEKNMCEILFENACVSKLTLADAILKGILPAPIYITTVLGVLDDIDKTEKRAKNKLFYEQELKTYSSITKEIRDEVDKMLLEQQNIKKYLPKFGKYLVFSSTIKNIEKDKKSMHKLFDDIEEYVVHSRISKEKNKNTLKEFRKHNGLINTILYSINLLNEGVHVKLIDAIFMMRKTTSPIIFFQQLGRLLSYSRRKDKVVVIDTVNNIKRNRYIYNLYIEVVERAKELIKTDPENKEHYEKILENFKIVDYSSKIYEKLDLLKELSKKENLYNNRLNIVLDILEGNLKVNDIERFQAQIDIFKYKEFMDINQFDRLKKLDIEKPNLLSLTHDEFVKYLDGNKTIYHKNNTIVKQVYNKVKKFYSINYHLPSITSNDLDEKILALDLMKYSNKFTEGMNNFMYEASMDDETLSLYEQIIYKYEKDIDINKLCNELDEILKLNLIIPVRIINHLEEEKTLISKNYLEKIHIHNLELSKNSKLEENINCNLDDDKDLETDSNILFREDFEKITKECMIELESVTSIKEYLFSLTDEIKNYIKDKHRMPKLNGVLATEPEFEYEKNLFYKKIIFSKHLEEFGYLQDIENTYENDQISQLKITKQIVRDKLIKFIDEHNGDFPSNKIDDPSEQELANKFAMVKRNFTEEDYKFLDDYLEKYNNRHNEVVTRYVEFIKKNRRYPLNNSTNEYELQLINDYIRNEIFLTKEEEILIKETYRNINKRKVMRNSYQEMLKFREEQKKIKK